MLIIICFGFMMLITSLVELPIAKTRMWQTRNIQLAKFDQSTLRCYLVSLGPRFWVAVVRPAIKQVPRSVVRSAHDRIVRCGLVIVPVSSETEDKFEGAMEVRASSRTL